MTFLIIKLLVDSVMVLLLIATIVYCFMVNRRIKVLQDSKQDFAKLIVKFDEATQKAQDSIEDLRKMSVKVNDSLNERLDKANFLADDLAFMIEKGNRTAEKMDGTMPRESRSAATALPPKREASISKPARFSPSSSAQDAFKNASDNTKDSGSKKNNVEAMLERLGDKQKNESSSRRGGRTSARLRSRAEQELQDAMKSGNES